MGSLTSVSDGKMRECTPRWVSFRSGPADRGFDPFLFLKKLLFEHHPPAIP